MTATEKKGANDDDGHRHRHDGGDKRGRSFIEQSQARIKKRARDDEKRQRRKTNAKFIADLSDSEGSSDSNQTTLSQFMDTNAHAADIFAKEATDFGNFGNGGGGSEHGHDGGYDTGPGSQDPDDGPTDEECRGSQGSGDGESERTDEDDLHGMDKRSGARRRKDVYRDMRISSKFSRRHNRDFKSCRTCSTLEHLRHKDFVSYWRRVPLADLQGTTLIL
jgi:hypothetical protein